MIGADVSNAQYLFACKMTEEKISKNVTDACWFYVAMLFGNHLLSNQHDMRVM